jgi:hypothetical protein
VISICQGLIRCWTRSPLTTSRRRRRRIPVFRVRDIDVPLLATSTSQVRTRLLHHPASTILLMTHSCQGSRRRPPLGIVVVVVRILRFSLLNYRGFDPSFCLIKGSTSSHALHHLRRTPSMPALRNVRTRPAAPPTLPSVLTSISSSPDPPSLRSLNDATTPVAIGDVPTEPSTPTSPTSNTRAFSRALQRQRSALFVHAVFHYDRIQNGLQPWFWYEHLISMNVRY